MRQEQELRIWDSSLEVRGEDGQHPTLSGRAVAYDVEFPVYDWFGAYTEVWRSGATSKAADDDVVLLVDHRGLPLARTTSGTLELREQSDGLYVSADLDGRDPDVARLVPKLRRGDMSAMSVGFRVVEELWSGDRTFRQIMSAELFDVAVVPRPANPDTAASVASERQSYFEVQRADDDLWRRLVGEAARSVVY